MRIIAIKRLRLFWQFHPDSEIALRYWYYLVKKASWNNSAEIKRVFATASIINKNRICFNIRGNIYRIITDINFDYKVVYIRFIGTHAEYDKINATEI